MPAADFQPAPSTVAARDGFMARMVKKLFLRQADVTKVDALTEHFYLITLQGDALRQVKWTPGDKIQVNLGEGFNQRTYTPILWDAERGLTRVLVYLHGETATCRQLRRLVRGTSLQFLGPRASLDLLQLQSAPLLFGDETCFGLAAALRQTAHGLAAPCVFEVGAVPEAAIVLRTLGIMDAVLVERTAGETHLAHVQAELQRLAVGDSQFVLAGKAGSIQAVKRALAGAGVSSARMKTKAYWAPGKIGMD